MAFKPGIIHSWIECITLWTMEFGIIDAFTLKFFFGIIIPLALFSFSTITYLTAIIHGYFYFYKKPNLILIDGDAPGVSIVKPLLGINPDTEANLETHFNLNYPKFEILFCVENEGDEVIQLVKAMMARYPQVDTRLFVGGIKGTVNPMVTNMAQGYENAKYDLVWISSSRVEVTTDIIVDLVNKSFDPNVALVHQVPFVMNDKTFADVHDQICFSIMARLTIFLNYNGLLCTTGMSYIVKKSILDKFGGLRYFGKYLAEDYFLSRELHSAGYKLPMSTYPARQICSETTNESIKKRLIRWHRLRLNIMLFAPTFVEPLIQTTSVALITSISLWFSFDINPLIMFCLILGINAIGDYLLLSILGNAFARSKFKFVTAWFYRELTFYINHIKGLMNRHIIKWGKRVYFVKYGGLSEEITGQDHTNKNNIWAL